jgi:flagellar motor switch protein FliN/FliY
MSQTAEATGTAVEENQADSGVNVQSVEFSEVAETASTGAAAGIDILLDLDVPITVIIGRTEISVQKLLQLKPGSVVKLDKSVDAPVDLYLKDTKFATGNIVVVEDRFAVKIKEILGSANKAEVKKQ